MSREEAILHMKMRRNELINSAGNGLDEDIVAFDMAIKALEQESQTFEWCTDCREYDQEKHCCHRWSKVIRDTVEEMKEPKTGHWIPVKWHEITDEEREREGYSKDWVCYLDSEMPYDGQRILVTTKGGYVELDECYSDDGQTFSLDSGYDWVDDIIAWMSLPEPYESQESEDKE